MKQQQLLNSRLAVAASLFGLCASSALAQVSWTPIGDEYDPFTFTGTRIVRYGAGSLWIEKSVTAAGQCTNDFFGADPAPGSAKQCELRSTPSTEVQWTPLVSEGTPFSVTGTRTVRYGVNGRWVQKAVTTGGYCTNNFFGTDPADGESKECELRNVLAGEPQWTPLAVESDTFSTSGTVRYGWGGQWLERSVASTGYCTNAFFGGDPADGADKVCELLLNPPTPGPSLPAVASSPTPVLNYEYDAEGNPTKTVQASGVSGFGFTTQNTFDALNRLKDSTNAKSGVTQFAYNGREDLTQVTDPRSLVTQTPRNGLGDTTSLVSPDTGTASHTYDAAGNLATRTDSRGVLATYSYDVLNRPTGVVYTQSSSSQTFGWSYDQTGSGYANGVGRLTSTSHPRGSTQYTYDAQGRVLNDTQRVSSTSGANSSQVSRTVGYGYDMAGHVTSITYPSGRQLSISWVDGLPVALGLAKDSVTSPTSLISQVQYAPFGGVKRWVWQLASSTQSHDRVYDASGRLVRYRLGEVVRDLSYDAADRITGYTHLDATTGTATTPATALNQSFSYDELGRLTGITTAAATWSLGYDANGNRTSVTLSGTTSTYTTASTSNRLNSITNPARSFGYDNAGNTTSDSGGYTSTYDLSGRLATLTKAGVTTTYSYDGLGRRVRKFSSTGASSTVIFVYDQAGQLLGEYDQSGTAIREYVWLGSTPVAVFTPDPASGTNPPLVYYIHADHLDTPRVVTDTAGNLRWRWLAEPFGTTAPETNPASIGAFTQNLRFPGQYADQESGLSYNYFRDYDDSLGRYVQSDPIGLAGGINTYTYAAGNPLTYVDPDGRVLQIAGGAVVGGVLGAVGNGFSSWTQGNRFFNGQALKNGFIGGAIGGAIASTGALAVGGAVGAGITDALNQGASLTCASTWKKVDPRQTAIAAVVGGAFGPLQIPGTGALGPGVNQAASIGVGTAVGNFIDFFKGVTRP